MESVTLLDSTNAMDTTFTMRDVIYIVSISVSMLTAWFGIQAKITKIRTDKELKVAEIERNLSDLKEKHKDSEEKYAIEVMSAKNGRNSIRGELIDEMEKRDERYNSELDKKEQVLHSRIDRVRDDNIKSYEKLERRIEDLDKKHDTNTSTILAAINGLK